MTTSPPPQDASPPALKLEDLMNAITNLGNELHATRVQQASMARKLAEIAPEDSSGVHGRPPTTGFRPPGTRVPYVQAGSDPIPHMRVDAPRFTGEDPTGWVFRVQKYFDYFLTPEEERFHLVAMLIDHPASEWFRYYQANNCNARWPEFLKAVQQRFDPSYYENYVGLLSKLTQTSSVMDYQTSFEALLNKVSGVPEATLVAMYIAGLKQPVQREVNLRTPTTLPAAFALARELSASYQDLQGASSSRRAWPVRQPATTPPGFPISANPSQIPPPSRGSFPPSKPAASSSLSQLPIVK
ncbi:unnamed protein product, partial [Cuscuta campestris]